MSRGLTLGVRWVALAGALMLGGVGLTSADASETGRIGETPASFTPRLLATTPNQYVRQLVQCGDTMYAVGNISAIGQGDSTYTRGNAFSFSATTGAVTSWDPEVDGMVHAIALSADCSTAYLGGSFSSVAGFPAANLAAVSTSSGGLRQSFAHQAGSEVDTLLLTRGMLLVGGTFTSINGEPRSKLASLNPTTGQVTSYADLAISGSYPNAWSRIYNAQLSHLGDRLLVEGVFTSIEGQPRQQVAVLDLGETSLTLDHWHAPEFEQACQPRTPFYVREAAWSPKDNRIYVAATGGRPATGPGSKRGQPRAGLCDAGSGFSAAHHSVQHLWVNYTGCDSYYTVVADGTSVYFGGHQRWASNPLGCDHAGEGAIPRPGLAAMSTKGSTAAWDPTRSRGHGAVDMLVTAAGLWVASDNFSNGLAQMCGGQTDHGGICFLPRE